MTTLSEDLTAWMAGGRGRFWERNFDLLIVRVRELEAEVVLTAAREQDAYVNTIATYQTRLEALEAYLERQAKAHQEVQTKLNVERDDALDELVIERDAYAKVAAEAQEHLVVALVREVDLTAELSQWRRGLEHVQADARRKALEEACTTLERCPNYCCACHSAIRELLEREPKP